MGWLLANLFLLAVVLTAAGYMWAAFFLAKAAGLDEYTVVVLAAFIAALIATYYTCKWLHATIQKRV